MMSRSFLGGEMAIGARSTIVGNVWIAESEPPEGTLPIQMCIGQ